LEAGQFYQAHTPLSRAVIGSGIIDNLPVLIQIRKIASEQDFLGAEAAGC
jgi:hypothetical protein